MPELAVTGAPPARRASAAVVMVIASALVYPLVDSVAKHLAQGGVPPAQIAWLRNALTALVLAPWVGWREGARAILPPRDLLHLLRSAFPGLVSALFFVGLARLPFADAAALLFVNPILITVLSGAFLGERIGPRRWAAVAVGLAGALVIVRPGAQVFSWASVAPLAAALAFAGTNVLSRRLAGHVSPTAAVLHYALGASVVLLPAAALGSWVTPDLPLAGWTLAMAAGGGLAMWLITAGYERAEASVLAPLHFLELAGAVVLGLVLFGEMPDAATWSGVGLILASGVYVATRGRE